jgi:hypothetical protein
MPIISKVEKERKFCQRVIKDEKKLRDEYNSSPYAFGTYDELIVHGTAGLIEHQEFLKKIIKLNGRIDNAIESGWMTEDQTPAVSIDQIETAIQPVELVAPVKIEEFSQRLYDDLSEKYCGRSGKSFKYKNESKGRFIEKVVAENQKEISKVKAVRETILRIFENIDISEYNPSQKELACFNEKSSDVAQDIEHLKRELVHLQRETERAEANFEKYQYAIIDKTIDDVQTKKKEEKKEKLTMKQIDAKLAKLTKEMEVHVSKKDTLTAPDDLIQYGVDLQLLKSALKKYDSEKKYFGRDLLQEEIDKRKEERRQKREEILEKSDEWLSEQLVDDVESEFIEKKYEVKKVDSVNNPIAKKKNPKMSSRAIIENKPIILKYLEMQGLEELFNDMQGTDKKKKAERFQRIVRSLSKSKNTSFEIASTHANTSPDCVQQIIHTLFNEWVDRERH